MISERNINLPPRVLSAGHHIRMRRNHRQHNLHPLWQSIAIKLFDIRAFSNHLFGGWFASVAIITDATLSVLLSCKRGIASNATHYNWNKIDCNPPCAQGIPCEALFAPVPDLYPYPICENAAEFRPESENVLSPNSGSGRRRRSNPNGSDSDTKSATRGRLASVRTCFRNFDCTIL